MEKYSLRGRRGVNLMHDFFNVLSDPLYKIIFLDNNRKNYMLSWPILVEKKYLFHSARWISRPVSGDLIFDFSNLLKLKSKLNSISILISYMILDSFYHKIDFRIRYDMKEVLL